MCKPNSTKIELSKVKKKKHTKSMPTSKYKNPLDVNKIYLEESVAQFLSK